MFFFILACSGPGAMDTIWANIATAQEQAMIVGAMTIVTVVIWIFVQRWGEVPLVAIGLFAVHPAWTISAVSGDCGTLKVQASALVTVLAAICLIFQATIWLWRNSES